jgi:hypothetical protein
MQIWTSPARPGERESIDAELVCDFGEIAWPIENTPVRLRIGRAESWPLDDNEPRTSHFAGWFP